MMKMTALFLALAAAFPAASDQLFGDDSGTFLLAKVLRHDLLETGGSVLLSDRFLERMQAQRHLKGVFEHTEAWKELMILQARHDGESFIGGIRYSQYELQAPYRSSCLYYNLVLSNQTLSIEFGVPCTESELKERTILLTPEPPET
ncbi:MAG: hypothetical protein R3191_03700 [Anaerolineales bacterium]|nr:hypothetical protein [Anaerolineales bacterium]